MKTRLIATMTVACVLAACNRQEPAGEMDWARAALARNPALEVISTDHEAGVFSVRDINSGALYKLRPQDLIAGPAPAQQPPSPTASAAPAASSATPVENTEPGESANAQPGEPAETQTIHESTVADSTLADASGARAGAGEPLVAGPGYSISRGSEQDAAPMPAPTLEGPGYSITRETTGGPQRAAPAQSATAGVERRTDPIICQGDRLMRIDGETIEFTGDAVIAENGCDLYISNARIRAGGIGIIARQARVHIVNSTINGSRGSYEAAEGAQIYVARSTFTGIGRRFDGGIMTDLGGNSYEAH